MAKFVPDIKTSRWVIIAPSRITRPEDNTQPVTTGCPLCPGNEGTNLELFRIGDVNSWKVRVIANKFPITDLHEVIIHSPDHKMDIDELPVEQVKLILMTYRARYNYHVQNNHGQVLIFNNHDVHAGASLGHPHSQLVVVPTQINLEVIPREPGQNVVADTDFFTVYCPDFSQWPYEVWVAPRLKSGMSVKSFGQIADEEIADLATLLQKILRAIITKFSTLGSLKQKVEPSEETGEIPYNYYIYHGQDWYLRIIPRLIHRAGFELGTGLSVNIVDPSKAAEEYRSLLTEGVKTG